MVLLRQVVPMVLTLVGLLWGVTVTFVGAAPLPGATITVDTTDVALADDGACSLREAIVNANNDAATHADCPAGSGDDTIVLAANATYLISDGLVYTGTGASGVTYTLGLPLITSNLILEGNGATLARDTAAGVVSFRLMWVTNSSHLVASNLTWMHGYAGESDPFSNYGGALTISPDAAATIDGGHFYSNTAVLGGAILVEEGSLNLVNSSLQHNRAHQGTAIENRGGIVSIFNTLVAENVSGLVNGEAGDLLIGGAINNVTLSYHTRSALMTISNSQVLSNTGPGQSNGIGNSAYQRTAILDINDSVIRGNQGEIGGGVLNTTNGGESRTNIARSEVSYNSVRGDGQSSGVGGGIGNLVTIGAASGTAIITVDESRVFGNSAVNGGGIINTPASATGFVDMQVHIDRSAIYNNVASGSANQTGLGGGIVNTDGTVNITNSTISGNQALTDNPGGLSGLGGGIANLSFAIPGAVNLVHSTVANNTALVGGGLLNASLGGGVNSTIQNSIIASNVALAGQSANCLNDSTAGSASIVSAGYNVEDANDCNLGQSGDLFNTDPLLGPLADNGGATLSHLLQAGSPAADVIPTTANGCGTTATMDQRSITRPQGTGCDIGAVEVAVPTAVTLTLLQGAPTGSFSAALLPLALTLLAGAMVLRRRR